jgi:enterochelin esterase family protein
LWLHPLGLHSQSFGDFLLLLDQYPDSLKQSKVDSFLTANSVFPIIEQDTIAHFLYHGTASSVTVPGDANGWDPSRFPMLNVTGTDLWYCTHDFESDARLDYKLVVNGSSWILDPRNPHRVTGGFGPNSELRMPDYDPPPEIHYYDDIPQGSLQSFSFPSSNLGNSRTIRVYTPSGYSTSSDSLGVIIFHDGLEYLSLANANHVLDYLIGHDRIEPIVAVFVPPVDRSREYAGDLKVPFSSFIVEELLPWIDSTYRTQTIPSQRATLGASNGGNISLWLGLNYPHVFGNIAAQSSNVEASISSGYQNSTAGKTIFYLDMGTYDIPLLPPLVANLVDIFDSKGYSYEYQLYHEGHSWGNWRAHIDNALELFFPKNTFGIQPNPQIPMQIHLGQNYPNPFNPETTLPFWIPYTTNIHLGVYNLLGEEIKTLVNGYPSGGEHYVVWDGTNSSGQRVSSGIYLYCMKIGSHFISRTMTLLR